ncbi:CUE domain-containing protein 1 [Notothenia coriiceps]|uniref:CUE domain-containing protein 1 n=1 Tax=Notothenia coriiceps TaxID=8208 RepID=A0A6I9NZN4_9TELE|nr:PREDICTED: CUE domain-containing protein 1 [Notothenia coriiceps]
MESCTGEQYSAASMDAVSDDAMFRDKLNHMGKSTRKKLFEIARTFSEKTKRRKSKRKMLLKHHSLGTANSTANLLDDVEANPCEEDGQPRRTNTQEQNEQRHEPVVWLRPLLDSMGTVGGAPMYTRPVIQQHRPTTPSLTGFG